VALSSGGNRDKIQKPSRQVIYFPLNRNCLSINSGMIEALCKNVNDESWPRRTVKLKWRITSATIRHRFENLHRMTNGHLYGRCVLFFFHKRDAAMVKAKSEK
jgi:hypothetical protein